jgi:ketosteroid isomerase-like protein
MQECIDKMAIKELLSRYSIAVDKGDVDMFVSIFTEDAVWEWPGIGIKYQGLKEIGGMCRDVYKYCPGIQRAQTNHVIEIKGDKAHSIDEITAFMSRPEVIYTFLQGFYEDDFVKVNGEWKIAHRSASTRNLEVLSQGMIGIHYKPLVDHLTGKK